MRPLIQIAAPQSDCESAANTDPSQEERKALSFRSNLASRRDATGVVDGPAGAAN
jgi:hypothetical protein